MTELRPLTCPKCNAPLPDSVAGTAEASRCPICQVELMIAAFPALRRGIGTGQVGGLGLLEGEAACFYHPERRATVPCDSCGRFLCALCDVDWGGKHFCPGCLESGKRKDAVSEL